jgi:hypothetical protein
MCTRPIPESFARRSGPIASIIFIILLLVWVMVSSLISSVQNRPHSSSALLAAVAAGKSPWPRKTKFYNIWFTAVIELGNALRLSVYGSSIAPVS